MNSKNRNKGRSYSIIVVSDATSANKEFSVSLKLIRQVIIGFSVLLLFFGFVIFHYLTITLDKQEMKRLQYENTDKQNKINELTATVSSLNQKVVSMEETKERIMVAMGLTSPLALKEVGSGGGPSESVIDQSFDSLPVNNIDLKPKPSESGILETARKIEENAGEIVDTLRFIESTIEKQKIRLAATPAIWPTRGYITDGFGWRIHPFTGTREFHNGIDIATQHGNKIIAPADGTVLVADYRDFYGNLIIIDHGFGYMTRYGHLANFNVKEGQRVKRWDVIGFVGNTGRSTSPHLHYEVRHFDKPINPHNYILD